MKDGKKKNIFEYNEESDESNEDDNEFKDIEGENIEIINNKKKIKKDLNNFDTIQKELKKYEGKNISYNKLQDNNSDENEEELEQEENEEDDNNKKESENNEEEIEEEEEEEENEYNSKQIF